VTRPQSRQNGQTGAAGAPAIGTGLASVTKMRVRSTASERQARPECSGRAWTAAGSFARNDRSVRPQEIHTVAGAEAMPLATTTSVLLPAGVPGGRVNRAEDRVPGATETEVQLLVRA
jgi:hypothetical protein